MAALTYLLPPQTQNIFLSKNDIIKVHHTHTQVHMYDCMSVEG